MKPRILFFGTSTFSQTLLKYLVTNDIPIDTVITQPDRPTGRKQLLKKSAVKQYALIKNIPVKQFEKIDQPALNFFYQKKPDLIILISFGLILPKQLISLPKFGAINVHPSLLPKYRGASPIQGALLHGDKITGVSLMFMNEKMDQGDLITQKKVAIDKNDTFPLLEKKLIQATKKILLPALNDLLHNKVSAKKQTTTGVSYTGIIKKTDGLINWHQPAEKIFNQYRAFYNWPGVFTYWQGKKILLKKILLSKEKSNHPPGKVFIKNNKFLVATKKNSIELLSIQLEGKNELAIQTFINGRNTFINALLG